MCFFFSFEKQKTIHLLIQTTALHLQHSWHQLKRHVTASREQQTLHDGVTGFGVRTAGSRRAGRRSGALGVGPRASRSLSTVHLRHDTRLRTAVVMRCSYTSLCRPSVAEHSPGQGGGALQ